MSKTSQPNPPSEENPSHDIDAKEIADIEKRIKLSLKIVCRIVAIVFGMYIFNAISQAISHSDGEWRGDWGTFGDYVGGILNPTIAGLALYWLINSIKLQIKELKQTNFALKETVKTTKKQQEQISLQNFESLFFELLKMKNEVTNDILVGSPKTLRRLAIYNTSNLPNIDFTEGDEDVLKQGKINVAHKKIEEMVGANSFSKGRESIKDHVILFKAHVSVSWEDFYNASFVDYAASYFRVCYQIINLIEKSDTLKVPVSEDEMDSASVSDQQKKYFDIFRSTLSQYELEAIFFNCLTNVDRINSDFKELVQKYSLFETMQIDDKRPYEVLNRLTRYAYKYNDHSFYGNDHWREYNNNYLTLRGIKKSDLIYEIKILRRMDFIRGIFFDSKKWFYVGFFDNDAINEEQVNFDIYKKIGEYSANFYVNKEINCYIKWIDELKDKIKTNNDKIIDFSNNLKEIEAMISEEIIGLNERDTALLDDARAKNREAALKVRGLEEERRNLIPRLNENKMTIIALNKEISAQGDIVGSSYNKSNELQEAVKLREEKHKKALHDTSVIKSSMQTCEDEINSSTNEQKTLERNLIILQNMKYLKQIDILIRYGINFDEFYDFHNPPKP